MCFKKKEEQLNTEPVPETAETPGESGDVTLVGETFVPSSYYPEQTVAHGKKKRGKLLLIIVLLLLSVAFLFGYSYWNKLNTQTAELFASPSPTPKNVPASFASNTAQPEQTEFPDPFAELSSNPTDNQQETDNIVNILLIGVDYAEERETWKGKDGLTAAHADVVIVLAVNFDKNTADLISLPRDTYTFVPGVSGEYKLNGSLNCGGGLLAENGAGFLKVCETASYLLGGIPVNYYYAVTMPAVKDLVDAIGGVDYRLETSFTMQGRSYHSGKQHMNGQAVLDYLRVRKESSGLSPGQTGDAHRVQRQRKMLVAIFEQLKNKEMLFKIADILDAFDGQLFTNCSKEQTASLALYGANMPSKNISMQSMVGTGDNLYSWNFSFIKQDKRVELIKRIYGIDVPRLDELTYASANRFRHAKIASQYINTCNPMTEFVEKLLAEDAASGQNKYGISHRNIYQKYLDMLDKCISVRETGNASQISTACSKLKRAALKCASTFNYREVMTWTIPVLADTNEVYVDFR